MATRDLWRASADLTYRISPTWSAYAGGAVERKWGGPRLEAVGVVGLRAKW